MQDLERASLGWHTGDHWLNLRCMTQTLVEYRVLEVILYIAHTPAAVRAE